MISRVISTVLFLLLIVTSSYGEDLPDSVKTSSQIVRDLKDCFQTWRVNRTIEEQKEFVEVSLQFNNGKDLADVLAGNIADCEKLKDAPIMDPELKSYVGEYVLHTIRNYQAMLKGIDSEEFQKDRNEYSNDCSRYNTYLAQKFALEKFINLTEAQYWAALDKAQYRKNPLYADYEKEKKDDLSSASKVLENAASQTTDFQELSIFRIEQADNLVTRYQDLHRELLEAYQLALAGYKAIIDQKRYSLYLFECWVKWRSVSQKLTGASKLSEIPNAEYDKVREAIAGTILEYVSKNPDDKMAINQYFLIATHGIINRFGPYQYGNQNAVEFNRLFGKSK